MPLTTKSVIALLKGKRRKQKYERLEQMTNAPGELRDIEIPEDKKSR